MSKVNLGFDPQESKPRQVEHPLDAGRYLLRLDRVQYSDKAQSGTATLPGSIGSLAVHAQVLASMLPDNKYAGCQAEVIWVSIPEQLRSEMSDKMRSQLEMRRRDIAELLVAAELPRTQVIDTDNLRDKTVVVEIFVTEKAKRLVNRWISPKEWQGPAPVETAAAAPGNGPQAKPAEAAPSLPEVAPAVGEEEDVSM